jgi:hypothetical protein
VVENVYVYYALGWVEGEFKKGIVKEEAVKLDLVLLRTTPPDKYLFPPGRPGAFCGWR